MRKQIHIALLTRTHTHPKWCGCRNETATQKKNATIFSYVLRDNKVLMLKSTPRNNRARATILTKQTHNFLIHICRLLCMPLDYKFVVLLSIN